MSALEERENTLKKEANEKVQEIIAFYRKKIEHVVAEIRKSNAQRESIKVAKNTLSELRERSERELGHPDSLVTDSSSYWPEEGETVWIKSVRSQGLVLRVDKKSEIVHLQVNNIKISTSPEHIRPVRMEDTKKSPSGGMVHYDYEPSIKPEIDLRGSRIDDISIALDRYIDQALLNGLSSIRIIHGKGSGKLRKKVQELLRKDKRIDHFKLGEWNEGGDGVTIVSFPS
jgi:DNA mismatch repair protein MutS2